MTTGDIDKPLMLLLHGFPELCTMWEHQISAFKEDFNVAAVDMRGYGRSDRPTVSCLGQCWSHPHSVTQPWQQSCNTKIRIAFSHAELA